MSEMDRIISEKECRTLTSLSRTTRWRLMRQKKFPGVRQLSPGRVGWRLSDVRAWLEDRHATGDEAA